MTMTHYANGYGKREQPPVCQDTPAQMECSCCQGQGEHPFGQGMDSDAVTCTACKGHGYLNTSIPSQGTNERTPKRAQERTPKRAQERTQKTTQDNTSQGFKQKTGPSPTLPANGQRRPSPAHTNT